MYGQRHAPSVFSDYVARNGLGKEARQVEYTAL